MSRELQSVVLPMFTLCLMLILQFISLFLAFDGSSLLQTYKVTIVQSLFESEDLMREAHRPQITYLFKKHHSRLSDNAHEFKGTLFLDGGSILYTINWRKENTFETLAGPANTRSL